MYMAGSTNRQNIANPATYPATLGDKLCLSCQLGQRNSQKKSNSSVKILKK